MKVLLLMILVNLNLKTSDMNNAKQLLISDIKVHCVRDTDNFEKFFSFVKDKLSLEELVELKDLLK